MRARSAGVGFESKAISPLCRVELAMLSPPGIDCIFVGFFKGIPGATTPHADFGGTVRANLPTTSAKA